MLRESSGVSVGDYRCVSWVVAGAVLLIAGCAAEMVPPPAEPAEEVSATEQALTGPLRIRAETTSWLPIPITEEGDSDSC